MQIKLHKNARTTLAVRKEIQYSNESISELKLNLRKPTKGRKLAVSVPDIISLSIFKQKNKIETKKSVCSDFEFRNSKNYENIHIPYFWHSLRFMQNFH